MRLKYSRNLPLRSSQLILVMMKKLFLEIKMGEKQLFLNLKIQMLSVVWQKPTQHCKAIILQLSKLF